MELDRMRNSSLVMATVVLVAACQSTPHSKPDATVAPTAVTPTAAGHAAAVLNLRAFYLERMLLPPGGSLDVVLFDDRVEKSRDGVIAHATFADPHGPPYDVALNYDPARLVAGASYGLRANLRDAQGRLQFATAERVPVTPGSTQRVEFRLVRAANP